MRFAGHNGGVLEGRRSGVRCAPVLGLVVVVTLIGAGAAWSTTRSASGRHLYPLPAAPAWPEPCPPPPTPPRRRPHRWDRRGPRARDSAGRWRRRRVTSTCRPSRKGHLADALARPPLDVARGVAHRTRSRPAPAVGAHRQQHRGYYGGPILEALVPAAHAAGIAVIAWDFPTLSDPAADATRARPRCAPASTASAPTSSPPPRAPT